MGSWFSKEPTETRDDTSLQTDNELDGASCLSEKGLQLVSKKLSKDWKKLGRMMGIPEPELECIEADDKVYGIEEMAYQMLLKWKKATGNATVHELKHHLNKIGRKDIAGSLSSILAVDSGSIQDGGRQSQSSHNSSKYGDWIADLKERLKTDYRGLQMKGLPWMEDLVLTLDEHYVDLGLIKMDKNGQELPSESMDIHDMFKAVDGIDKLSRILVEGGPGLGKSTFAAKLAYDWAKGESYIKHFDLVFLIPLRHFQGKLEEIICDAASIDEKDQEYLLKILNNKSKHILILMDGYDEISPIIESEIQPVLRKKSYPHTTIVVTSRPGMFSTNKSQTNDGKFPVNADVGTNYFNFLQKRICMRGFNSEQQEKFVKIHTRSFSEEEKRNIASKLDQMVDKEFLKCPLFLLLLILVLSENPDINTTSRTDLYKHIFKCIIRRYFYKLNEPSVPDMDLFSMNIEFLDSEKPSYIQLMLQFSEFSLWSVRENKLVFSFEDITKTGNRDSKFLELGFLTQSVSVARLRQTLVYEPVHRSLLEFGAAYGLWLAFMQKSMDNDLKEKVISILKGNSSLCLSFLLGLAGDQAGTIFNILLPYKSFYSTSFKDFLPCLAEIQIHPSVLQSLSPFLPPKWDNMWMWKKKERCLPEKYEEIVRSGLQAGSIKEIIWDTRDEEPCIPPETEIGNLRLEVRRYLPTARFQNPFQKYRQTKMRCKRLYIVLTSSEVDMTHLKQILSIIEHEHLTVELKDIDLPHINEFIFEVMLDVKTIHRVILNLRALNQPSIEIIDKMVRNKHVEQLELVKKYELEDQEPLDILCSLLAKATSLRGFTFVNDGYNYFSLKLDLANLFDGGRESWDELRLIGVTVKCTKEIEKELSINCLNLQWSVVSESAAQLFGHYCISSLECHAELLHHFELSRSTKEVLTELNIIVDETVDKGISALLTQFPNLEILGLAMSYNRSLNVSFENWLFGCNESISLRGLEIWNVFLNPKLALELVKGISGCVTQLQGNTSCKQKLELQYLLLHEVRRIDYQRENLEMINELKSALIHGDLPRLDFVSELLGIRSQELFQSFPVEEGFQTDCDLWEKKYVDSEYKERYSITFNGPTKD